MVVSLVLGMICIVCVLIITLFNERREHQLPKIDWPEPDQISWDHPNYRWPDPEHNLNDRAFLDVMVMEEWDELEGGPPSTF